MKLTEAQWRRLREIAAWKSRTGSFPGIGFFASSRTDKKLLDLGLIETFDAKTPFIGSMMMTVACCQLTVRGRSALQDKD